MSGTHPEYADLRAHAARGANMLVLSHKDADGDTLGSALAMRDVLESMGNRVQVRVPEPVPETYAFLPGFASINRTPDGWSPDVVWVMDASNLERLADVMGPLDPGTPVLNIDHHVSNTRFGTVNLVVPEASSTAEVVFDMLQEWGVEVTPSVATNLYAGVLTDTGGFRHENTSERVLTIAAQLVHLGADPAGVAEAVYKSRRLSTLKLQALAMGTIEFECEERLVHGYVTREQLRRAGARMDESEGLIDLLNSVDGLELAILFKEIEDGLTKVSVRSRGDVNANEVAGRFGGGGHQRAAGAELQMALRPAMEAFLREARSFLTPAAD